MRSVGKRNLQRLPLHHLLQWRWQPMPTIKIDNQDYDLGSLSDEAKA